MEEKRGKELPRFLKYPLCETILMEHLEKYKYPCLESLHSIDSMAEHVFSALVNKTFQPFDEISSDFKVILTIFPKLQFYHLKLDFIRFIRNSYLTFVRKHNQPAVRMMSKHHVISGENKARRVNL